MLKAPLHNADN